MPAARMRSPSASAMECRILDLDGAPPRTPAPRSRGPWAPLRSFANTRAFALAWAAGACGRVLRSPVVRLTRSIILVAPRTTDLDGAPPRTPDLSLQAAGSPGSPTGPTRGTRAWVGARQPRWGGRPGL